MSLPDVLLPLVSLLVLCIPGTVVALVAGLRLGTSVAVGPLLTYGMTTAAATIATYVNVSWRPWTLLLATVLTSGIALGVRLLRGRGAPWRERIRIQRPTLPGRKDLLVIAGVLAGGALSAAVLRRGMGSLGAPNQDWDYVFHANAVRLISDSGDIAPAALGRINDWETANYYYPNTFHGVAALVRDLTGASVFEVLNSQAMIICLVTGMALAGLLHRLRAPLAVTALSPLLLAGFTSFPYDVLWRGPLLPFAAGVAVIPALILLLDTLLRRPGPATILLFALGAAGLLGVHPSAALSGALFVVVYVLVRWGRAIRSLPKELLVLAVAGVVSLLIAAPAVLGAVNTGTQGANIDWPAVESAGQATGDLLLLNHSAPGPQWWLAGLVIVGLLTVSRVPYMWAWLGGAAINFALFVIAASSDSPLAEDLTRPWWNDRWRFAAVAVLGLVPLAAHGLLTLAQWLPQRLRVWLGPRGERVPARRLTWALLAAGLLVVVLASHGLYVGRNSGRIAANYKSDRLLSPEEISAMHWLQHHSTGGAIMNDANDGSAYLSAVAGLHPLFGHIVDPPQISLKGPTQQLLLEHFNCIDSDPQVRAAVKRLDVRYVWLGTGFVRAEFKRVPGLVDITESPSLKLVHQEPGVEIYRVHLAATPSTPVAACDLRVTGSNG